MNTREIAEKMLAAYYAFRGGPPDQKGTMEYNRKVACVETMIEAVAPDLAKAARGKK